MDSWRLDEQLEKIAVLLALQNEFHHASLRKISEVTYLSISEVSKILLTSNKGVVENYGTKTLLDDVFILKREVDLIKNDNNTKEKYKIQKNESNSSNSEENIPKLRNESDDDIGSDIANRPFNRE